MSAFSELEVRVVELYSEPAQFLIHRLADELSAIYDENEETKQNYIRELKPVSGSVFVVAFWKERPIGCGAVRPLEAGVGEVKRVFVEADMRRKGVSRAIMEALEAQARNLGYQALRLETGTPQVAAIRLYESIGYLPCPCYGRFIGDPLSVCFEKSL